MLLIIQRELQCITLRIYPTSLRGFSGNKQAEQTNILSYNYGTGFKNTRLEKLVIHHLDERIHNAVFSEDRDDIKMQGSGKEWNADEYGVLNKLVEDDSEQIFVQVVSFLT